MFALLRTRRSTITWALFAALVAWTAFVVGTRFRVQSDVWAFLPTVGDSPQQRMTRNLLSGKLSQALVLAVTPDPKGCVARADCSEENLRQARQVAAELTRTLKTERDVAEVNCGPSPGFEQTVYDLYFTRRFALASGTLAPYSQKNLQAHVAELKAFLASPKAAVYRSQLVSDPLLFFPKRIELLASLKPSGVELVDNQFVTSGGMALVLISLQPNLDGEAKARLYQLIERSFAKATGNRPTQRLLMSGALPFEVVGETTSKADVQRISMISMVMTVALALLLFRNVLALAVVLLPVAVGFLFGCAATLVTFGEIHVLTLAFGAALIGVSQDYPLHVLNEAALHQFSLREATRHVRPGLMIGCLTTVVGFCAFGLTSATALLQVAVFAVSGLLSALLCTLYVLPLLSVRVGPGALQRHLAAQMSGLLPAITRHAGKWASALGVLLLLCSAFVFSRNDKTDPHTLDPSPQALKDNDRLVRAQLGLSEDMLVVTEKTQEEAIAASYRLAEDLTHRKQAGSIDGFRSITSLYLPRELQLKNRQDAASPVTRRDFLAALEAQGFESSAFASSPLGTAEILSLPLLTLDDLRNSALGPMSAPFFFSDQNATSVVTQVAARPEAIAEVLRAHPNVVHYQPELFLARSFTELAHNIRQALVAALLLMFLIVFGRNRNWRATLSAFLPAATGSLGALCLAGLMEPLNVFHMLAAVIVLSTGIDYGTLMVEIHRQNGRPDAWPSVIAAALSTLISFGGLAFSSVPALRALGLVTGVGTFIALLATPLCYSVLPARALGRNLPCA